MSDNTNEYQVLLDVVRQNYASVVWTHKIQIKQADIYATRYRHLENINVILAAATSCGAVSIFAARMLEMFRYRATSPASENALYCILT